MGFDDFLIKVARAVLDSVLTQITQVLQMIEEQAMQPMRMVLQMIMGGVWIGKGADAFVEEVQSLMIPDVGRVSTRITKCQGDINFARNVIDRADADVSRLVKSNLADKFKFY
jgi:hypothetical protein